ncbi:GlxA family transcriptional regulator [Shimia sagamensis]|uniref:Transcriptional regulator, AraC family with amidase-like domain n=1 Tax=Shimia sagamensis TaxID=1566352 RepID=A0ABY1NQ96_9RHOB|nr:GlxA family transcriptional regulator [Shimia sagamensis]SMP14335.1 transcriptional regulator, AraC family with amidase-like domain [Shimia sagamensis]
MPESAESSVFRYDPAPLNVAILVLDECNTLSFAATVDPMRAANRRAGKTLFEWQFYTATEAPASLTSGLQINGLAIDQLLRCDLLLVVAGFRLEEQATPRLLASLRRLYATGTSIAAIDGGPWFLAKADLLDGHNATTHWEDIEKFSQQFPKVTTLRDRFCISGRIATSGGASPCIDMMLYLIETRYGTDLAHRVSSAFLYDPMPASAQRPISIPRTIHRHPRVITALDLMGQTLDAPLPIPEIAIKTGISTRTLELNFQTHLRKSPQAVYLTMRLEEALRLATETQTSVRDIALATGFNSPTSFARAFKAAHGTSVRALRTQRR